MLLTYIPEGAERREWEFKPDDTWHWEAELIESVGWPTWVAFDDDYLTMLRAGNFKARRALLWILLRRDDPQLTFSSVAVKTKELPPVEMDPDERRVLRERLADPEERFTQSERTQAEQLLANYPDDEDQADEPVPVGKDGSGESGTASP